MSEARSVQANLFMGGIIFLLFLLISLFSFSSLAYKPNALLIGIICILFFIDDLAAFLLFLSLQLAWFKYIHYATSELIFFVLAGVVLFALLKWFIFSRRPGVFVLLLLVVQGAFWALFYRGSFLFSLPFVMEFFYNCIIGIIVYSASIWLAKRYI